MKHIISTLLLMVCLIFAQDISLLYSPWETSQVRAELDYPLWQGSILFAKLGMWNHINPQHGAGLYVGLPVKVALFKDVLKVEAATNYGFGYITQNDKWHKYANGQVNFALSLKLGRGLCICNCKWDRDVYFTLGIGYTLFRYAYNKYHDVVSLLLGFSFSQ